MRDEWFPHIAFAIGWDEFHQLPKNPTYKWEYWDGTAHLSARPKCYHCLLDLTPREAPHSLDACYGGAIQIRRLRAGDWRRLPRVFRAAFSRMVPFSGMKEKEALKAARHCLDKTRRGGDGPLVEPACFVATDPSDGQPVGAILVTLAGGIDLASGDLQPWKKTSKRDRRAVGLPHLTWIFVAPLLTRYGIGTALLDNTINALIALGHMQLASTFMLGNESSTLWHWMNGFHLGSWMGSPRATPRRIARRKQQEPERTPQTGAMRRRAELKPLGTRPPRTARPAARRGEER